MNPPLAARQIILLLALAATLLAAFWVSRQDARINTASQPVTGRKSVAPSQAPTQLPQPSPRALRLPDRSAVSGAVPDIFDLPVAPQATPGVTEKPHAPPLPFNFIGRYVDAGVTYVFLELGAQLHTAKVGDTIENTYRIERIDKDIHLIYLPLKERQTLPIGDMQ